MYPLALRHTMMPRTLEGLPRQAWADEWQSRTPDQPSSENQHTASLLHQDCSSISRRGQDMYRSLCRVQVARKLVFPGNAGPVIHVRRIGWQGRASAPPSLHSWKDQQTSHYRAGKPRGNCLESFSHEVVCIKHANWEQGTGETKPHLLNPSTFTDQR